MEYVPDSDEEQPDQGLHLKNRLVSARNGGDDVIYSDGEDDYSIDIIVEPDPEENKPSNDPTKAIKPRAPLHKAPKKNTYQHKKLFSSAVLAARQQQEAAAPQATTELPLCTDDSIDIQRSSSNPLINNSQVISQNQSQNAFRRLPGKPAFLGRKPLAPSLEKQTEAPMSVANDDAEKVQGEMPTEPPPQQLTRQIQPPPVTRTQDSMDLVSNAVMTKNADGLNVVVLRRKESETQAAPVTRNVNTGWGNNFVKIDMKRGHGSTKFKASRHSFKRKRGGGRGGRHWKVSRLRQVGDGSDYLEGWEGQKGTCFKCGGSGHWAQNCTAQKEMAMDIDDGDASDEEMDITRSSLANQLPNPQMQQQQQQQTIPTASIPEEYLEVATNPTKEGLERVLKEVFGFETLRSLQLQTITHVLKGQSCLSIMPTGTGKSLCFQLPSLLTKDLTLVVSPLIALMKDQCAATPPCLPAAMLSSDQSQIEAKQILADVESGLIRILFVSPERMTNPYLLAALQPRMPLGLVVVDEAHCVAEWGHSFRPSYFRLGGILQRQIQSRSILALTATATKDIESSVCSVLGISGDAVLRDAAIMPNLRLNITRQLGQNRNNWNHIVALIKTGKLADVRSIIVYCAWKADADAIAKALQTAGVTAKAYHAGRNSRERSEIEKLFAAGRIRVTVATVAFGMGINLHAVKGIVHATVPRSLEEYVQQVGRAGRDGSEGKCFAFLDDRDFVTLRSLAYSGVTEEASIRKLLNMIFEDNIQEGFEENGRRQFGMLAIKKLSVELDLQEETIESLLSFLEAQSPPYVRVLAKMPVVAKVSFYAKTPEQLMDDHPVVPALISVSRSYRGAYSVPLAELGTAMQKPPGSAVQDLQVLAADKVIGFSLAGDRGLAYELLRLPEDLDKLAEEVQARLAKMLSCQIERLDKSYRALSVASAEQDPEKQEASLRSIVQEYFDAPVTATRSTTDLNTEGLPLTPATPALLTAAKAVINKNTANGGPTLTATAIARILHGVDSPAYPRDKWSKQMGSFWGSHKTSDFSAVFKAATIACRE